MDYLGYIQRAVDYIEENLQKKIGFMDAAQAVGFSPFHFQRIFSGVVGESVTEYIRKRRFTVAAQELTESDRRILDIALDYCFESQATFTRAFKQVYGLTPGEYRRQGKPLILLDKPRLTADRLNHLTNQALEPRIIQLGRKRVIGLHYLGTNEAGEIPALWRDFNRRLHEMQSIVNPGTALGVCEPIPHMTSESEVSYLACVEVGDDVRIPEGMTGRVLAPQTYAVFTHRGPADNLDQTYQYIFGTYFPRTGLRAADAPDFELYDQRFDPVRPDSVIEIYTPIERY